MPKCDYCLVECRETGVFACKHVVCRNCGMSQNKCLVCAKVGSRKRGRIVNRITKREDQQLQSESFQKQQSFNFTSNDDIIQSPSRKRQAIINNDHSSNSIVNNKSSSTLLLKSSDQNDTQPTSKPSSPLDGNSIQDKVQDEKSISSKEKDDKDDSQNLSNSTPSNSNHNHVQSSSTHNTPTRKSNDNDTQPTRNIPPSTRSTFKSKRLQQKHNQKKAAIAATKTSTTNPSKRSNSSPSSSIQDKEKDKKNLPIKKKLLSPKTKENDSLEILHAPTVYDDYRCELIPQGSTPKLPRPALRFSGKLTIRILIKFISLTLKLVPEKIVTVLCSGEELSNEMTMESIYNFVGSAKKQCMVFHYKVEDKVP